MSDPETDAHLRELLDATQKAEDRALAARYAPILRFDAHEPFFPLAVGYTIFRHNRPSPSFRQGHPIDLAPDGEPPAHLAIEYAIWWDWDIGHLYELEHVWVYVDASGRVVRGEASWHGGLHDMRHEGKLALNGAHLIVYSEPGKHAFAPTPDWFRERAHSFKRSETRDLAGKPVAAELSLAMVEQALLARFQSPLPSIQEFFRGARRQSAVRADRQPTAFCR